MITVEELIRSKKIYKERAERQKKFIEEMKEIRAPKIILEHEERHLKESVDGYKMCCLAISMYKQGVLHALMNEKKAIETIDSMLSPEEKLMVAIFSNHDIEDDEDEEEEK